MPWSAPAAQEVSGGNTHRSSASMCPACLRSTAWLLALMQSADRVPNQVNALQALCSPGFGRSPVWPVCHHHSALFHHPVADFL